MKRKLSKLLAVILAMTMVMVLGISSYAEFPAGTPTTVPAYAIVENAVIYYLVMSNDLSYDGGKAYVTGRRFWVDSATGSIGGYTDQHGAVNPRTDADSFIDSISVGWYYMLSGDWYRRCPVPTPPDDPIPSGSSPAHTHSFTWQTIYEATPNSDGLEGEVCSCGATRNTSVISAMDYAINKYADQMIKAAKPGQKITLEFGEFNSFPRYMMEKVAARMNDNITFVFKFKQNKKMQTVTIEPGTAIDLQYDWYGPDKMKGLYGAE